MMRWLDKYKRFRLTVDGQTAGMFRTYQEAWDAAERIHDSGGYRANWSVEERVGGRYFNKAFGYKTGTTSTADLAAMGVPIHPPLINDQKR